MAAAAVPSRSTTSVSELDIQKCLIEYFNSMDLLVPDHITRESLEEFSDRLTEEIDQCKSNAMDLEYEYNLLNRQYKRSNKHTANELYHLEADLKSKEKQIQTSWGQIHARNKINNTLVEQFNKPIVNSISIKQLKDICLTKLKVSLGVKEDNMVHFDPVHELVQKQEENGSWKISREVIASIVQLQSECKIDESILLKLIRGKYTGACITTILVIDTLSKHCVDRESEWAESVQKGEQFIANSQIEDEEKAEFLTVFKRFGL